ncbi:MAG: hypothetical protein V1886_00960 [archaeon]
MLKRLSKLGLTALLSLSLAGCATTNIAKIETEKRYGGPVEQQISREIVSSKLNYSIDKFLQNNSDISVYVSESKKDNIIITTRISKEVFEGKYEVVEHKNYGSSTIGNLICLPLIILGSQPIEPATSTERRKVSETKTGTEKTTRKKERTIDAYINEPARNILVKISSQDLGFGDDKADSVIARTDANGIAKVKITKKPFLFYFPSDDVRKDLKNIMLQQTKKALQEKIVNENYSFKAKEYPVTAKTISDAGAVLSEEGNVERINDEKTFSAGGMETDISNLLSQTEQIIMAELESKYKSKIISISAVGEDLLPVEAYIWFKSGKELGLEEVLEESEKIKEKYLVKDLELYKRVQVDSASIVKNNTDKGAVIPVTGFDFSVNVPSEYRIRIMKEEYAPVDETIKFTEKMKGKIEVKLNPLSKKFDVGSSKSSFDVE